MARARTTTARRYAEAAFEIAERDGTTEQWLTQLDRITAALTDRSVIRRLEDPHAPFDLRHAAFRSLFTDDDMLPQVWNLLGLMLRRRRLESMADITREFHRLYNRRAGVVEALATSAAELAQDEVAALRARLEKMTGGKIDLNLRVDPELLGGVQVRLGDLLIDGSVRGRLERLRGQLAAGALRP